MWSCEPSGGRGGSATRAARRVGEPVRAGGSAGMTTVGVVGLGLLGSAVAARLRAGGHVVVGYDVVAEKVQALVAVGGRAAPTAEGGAAAAEALLMARAAGLDPGLVLDVLCRSAASSRMLEVRGPLIARAEFPPQMKLDLFMKDLHLIQEAARRVGAPLPLTDVAERLYAVAMEAGHGGADLSVVVKAFEGPRRI